MADDLPEDLPIEYQVATDEVVLVVTIGEGDRGRSLVELDGQQLALGEVKRLPLGSGESLTGKKLLVRTMVNDLNDKTNHMSARYELEGGTARKTVDFDGEVDEEGGSVIFEATFKFKA